MPDIDVEAREETITLGEYRDRALRLAMVIEAALMLGGGTGRPVAVHVSETLMAVHIVQRRLEEAIAASDLTAEQREFMVAQLDEQRKSYDEHRAEVAAEEAAKRRAAQS